jgi:N-acylneuraminate cytidylyltransferase
MDLLHAVTEVELTGFLPEVLVVLDPTWPFIDPAALSRAVKAVAQHQADVVIAATPSQDRLWWQGSTGRELVDRAAGPHPRRRDLRPRFREIGAFKVLDATGFLSHKTTNFGSIDVELVRATTAWQTAQPGGLAIGQALARLLDPVLLPTVLAVNALVTGFEGVHTDNKTYLTPDGRESVSVDRADAQGISQLRQAGLPVALYSVDGATNASVRAAKLAVPLMQGDTDPAAAVLDWLKQAGVDPTRAAYLARDPAELPAMAAVGWPCAVADAHPEVLAAARFVTTRPGGSGAVGELADRILSGRSTAAQAWLDDDGAPAFARPRTAALNLPPV